MPISRYESRRRQARALKKLTGINPETVEVLPVGYHKDSSRNSVYVQNILQRSLKEGKQRKLKSRKHKLR